jgi:hypothetical protein
MCSLEGQFPRSGKAAAGREQFDLGLKAPLRLTCRIPFTFI